MDKVQITKEQAEAFEGIWGIDKEWAIQLHIEHGWKFGN